MCQVKIINIEERKKWWYYVCNKGHDGLKIVEEEEYQCDECKRIIPVPEKRFQICILYNLLISTTTLLFIMEPYHIDFIQFFHVCSFRLCVNVEDESGGAAIVLFDREVHRIIGKNVYEVVNLQNKVNKP